MKSPTNFRSKPQIILLTIFIFFIIIILQLTLLSPILGISITADDWYILTWAKTLDQNFLNLIYKAWFQMGPHYTYQVIYINLLERFLGNNYLAYPTLGVIFKIIATFSIFPTIMIIFKNKLLAFLATIYYAISYSATGSLRFIVTAPDYLAVTSLNIFLIVYFLVIKNNNRLPLLCFASILLLVTYLLSPPRILPLSGIIILIELFLLFNQTNPIRASLLRLILLFTPIAIILSTIYGQKPSELLSSTDDFSAFVNLLEAFKKGNWQSLFNPVAGLGHMLLAYSSYTFLGTIRLENFWSYMSFLMKATLPIFSIISFLLALLLSKKPLYFFILLFSVNLLLDILLFYISTHHFYLPSALITSYNLQAFYTERYFALVGNFILAISITAFAEWFFLTKRKNHLLLILAISPFFALVFTISTYLMVGTGFDYDHGIQRYLIIPELGISLFWASLSVLILQKLNHPVLKSLGILFVLLTFIFNIIMTEIEMQRVQYSRSLGDDIYLQTETHEQLLKEVPLDSSDLLFGFIQSSQDIDSRKITTALGLDNIHYWFNLKRNFLISSSSLSGCIGTSLSYEDLKRSFVDTPGEKSFLHTAYCTKEYSKPRTKVVTFPVNRVYVFSITSGKVQNITEEVIDNLIGRN